MKAREALSKALAVQEEQEALFAEGEEVGSISRERESNAIPVHSRRTCDGSTCSGRAKAACKGSSMVYRGS